MAHFYGTIKGARGKASRLGSANSGLQVIAASWQGAVQVTLSHKDGKDWATVALVDWHGRGPLGGEQVLYVGPVEGANPKP